MGDCFQRGREEEYAGMGQLFSGLLRIPVENSVNGMTALMNCLLEESHVSGQGQSSEEATTPKNSHCNP